MPEVLDVKNRVAFEYSKRKFVRKYGPDIPVWALLASGSTGGVRLAFSLATLYIEFNTITDRILALLLSSRCASYNSPSHRILTPSLLETSSSRAYNSVQLLQKARLCSTSQVN